LTVLPWEIVVVCIGIYNGGYNMRKNGIDVVRFFICKITCPLSSGDCTEVTIEVCKKNDHVSNSLKDSLKNWQKEYK